MCKINFLEFQGCNHTPWHSAQRCPQFANNPDPQATCKLPSPTLEKGYHLFPDILCVKCFPDPEHKNLAKCDADTIKRWDFWKEPSITEAKVQRLIAASPPEDPTQHENSKSPGFSLRKTIGKTKKVITNAAKDNLSKVGLSRRNSEKSHPLSNDSGSSSPGPSEDSEGPRLLNLQFQLSQLNQLKASRGQSGNDSVMTGISTDTKWDDVVKEGNDFGSSSWEATIEARKARKAEKKAHHESVQAEFDREMELVHAKQKNEMALRRRKKRLAASDETQPSSGDLRQRGPPRTDTDKPLPKPSDFPLPGGALKASNEQNPIQQNRQHNRKSLRPNPFIPALLQPMKEVESIRSESSDDEDISTNDSYSRYNQAEASRLHDNDEIGHSPQRSQESSRPSGNYFDPQSTEEARPKLRPGNTFPRSFQEEGRRDERPLQLRHGKTFPESAQQGNSRLQDGDVSRALVGNTDHATNSPPQEDSNSRPQGQQASTSALASDTKGSGSSFPKVPISKFNTSTSSKSSRSENPPEDSGSDCSDTNSNPREAGFSRQQDKYGAGLASIPEKPMPSGPQKTAAAVTSTMERRPVTFSEDKKSKSDDVFQTGQGTGREDYSFSVKKEIRSESGSGNAKPTNLAQQAKRAGYLPAKSQTPYNTWPRATTAKQTTPEEELKFADEHLARVRDGRGCTDCTKKRCHWKE